MFNSFTCNIFKLKIRWSFCDSLKKSQWKSGNSVIASDADGKSGVIRNAVIIPSMDMFNYAGILTSFQTCFGILELQQSWIMSSCCFSAFFVSAPDMFSELPNFPLRSQ